MTTEQNKACTCLLKIVGNSIHKKVFDSCDLLSRSQFNVNPV